MLYVYDCGQGHRVVQAQEVDEPLHVGLRVAEDKSIVDEVNDVSCSGLCNPIEQKAVESR